ncbi:MAG: M23 family metallopeptidase [Actinomycetota bacterium]
MPALPPPLVPSAYGYGPFDNAALVVRATQLRAFGRSESYVLRDAYAPFIIGGPAHWTNSWGALRYDPDGTIRRHLGQDVFCGRGSPVLAAERGIVEFGSDRLGGLVARLHREDGGYFYYAHLSAWNDEELSSGDRVSPGQVIGYCGDSGNAAGSAPHVHFGFYAAGPQDPMGFLLDWDRRARARAGLSLDGEVAGAAVSELARRFGDELVPDPEHPVEGAGETIEVLVDAALKEPGPHRNDRAERS